MKSFRTIMWGIGLIILGVLLGLREFDVISFNIFFDGWWTLFIIVPCFINLFNENEKTGDLIGLIIGIALLLCCQNVISFDLFLRLMVPGILVIIGLSFLFKDLFTSKVTASIKKLNETKNGSEIAATFGSQKINYDEQEFKGATLNAIFGSIDLDLRKAVIKEDVVINTSSIFGGIDIRVSEDVKVVVKSSSIFGGVDDERKKKKDNEKAKTIYINANCLFGGVDVK